MNGRCDIIDVVEYMNYDCHNLNCFKCKYCWFVSRRMEGPLYNVKDAIDPFAMIYSEGEVVDTSTSATH